MLPDEAMRPPEPAAAGGPDADDGLPHDWFKGRGPVCTMIVYTDDATYAPYPWPESSVRAARTTRRRTPSVRPSGRPSRSAGWRATVRLKHHRRYRGRFARLAGLARFLTASPAAGLLLALGVSLLIMPMPAQAQGTAQSVTYRVTFEGKFTASALASGVSVPSGEHFTTLIGAVHNGSATFWSSGGTASAGIEAVAELGTTGTFQSEVNAAMPDALAVIEQSIASGGTAAATVDITLTTDHPLVTLLTMIAPSPDWFAGVSGLSLLDAQNVWLSQRQVDLFPYDAGTEEGTEFSLNNAATSPQGTIASIQGTGKFSNEPIATLTFDLLAPPVITTTSPILVTENETAVETLTASDDDTASDQLAWSIPSGGADADKFTLGSTGVLAFTSAPDYEAPADADTDNVYEVTVQVSDSTNTVTAALEVTVENVIELTTLTGPSSVAFPENSWSRVATFTASSEEDRAGIEWILEGTDAAHFSIDSPPGALRFALPAVAPRIFPEPPDFEAPVDPDAANTYELTVSAEAGSSVTDTQPFTVTVTDVDEAGALSLSSTRPALGAVLTAVLTDPDGVTAGTAVWQWERSTGRNSWAVIDGAAAASYTPVAADTNTFLRVTATYEDEHGTGKTVSEVAPNVVTGPLLTGLTAESDDSRADTARGLYPAFDPQTLHYGIGCNSTDTLVLTVSAAANARVAVAGVQAASAPMSVDVSEDSDVAIRVTDASGAGTTYVVHCLPEVFFEIETVTFPNTDAFEDLILFNRDAYLRVLDRNGVPRLRLDLGLGSSPGTFAFRFHRIGADGAYRYGFYQNSSFTVLDEDFEVVDEDVRTVAPLTVLDAHDFQILEDGNYLLMSYEPAMRNFSDIDLPYFDGADVSSVDVLDAAFQIVTPGGHAVFTWNSWGNMAIEDCVQHRFPVTLSTDPDMRSPRGGYAHINGMHVVDGVLVASMRGCSKVLGIDVEPGVTRGDVLWRMGRTNLSDAQWAARDIGPRPLDFINDPEGEFCGQHTARFLPNGNVFLFDNGVVCAIDPWTFEELGREGYDFSRAVEYALDLDNHEAVFVRDHSLRGERSHIGYATGNVDVLDNGDWLVSWGRALAADDRFPDNEMATLVDPATGQEKLGLRFRVLPSNERSRRINATVAPAEALAPQPVPLTAEFPAGDHTSLFHTGAGDSPQVVVAFNRPVVDFTAATQSVSVSGAAIESVSPHVVAGEAANAYAVTLTPAGAGDITVGLVAGEPCASGGICTADGAGLETSPGAVTIPGPVTASVQGNASVTEGESTTIVVILQPAHGRTGDVEVPLSAHAGSTAVPGSDYDLPASVTFGPADTARTVTLTAAADSVVEGGETVVLGVGSPLPDGFAAGTTTTVTIGDATDATLTLTVGSAEVAEGNSTDLTFSAGTGITFTTDQTIAFTLGGTAQADDYTVSAGGATLSAPYSLTLPAGANAVTATLRVEDDASREENETVVVDATHGAVAIGSRTVTIPANDHPNVTVRSAGGGPMEGTELTFTLTNTETASDKLTVAVLVEETRAMLGAAPPAEATFAAGSSTATLTVATTDDRVAEEDSEVTVTVLPSSADTYDVGSPQSASVTVTDNDAAPSLVLSVSASTIGEDGGTATATVSTGSGSTFATEQTVRLAVAGTATETVDYTVSGKTLTLPAGVGTGASMVTATVTGVDDSLDDDDETIEITGSRNGVVFGSRQTIAIEDDDWPELTVTFRQADYRVAEGGRVELPVTLSAVPERQVTIPIEFEDLDGAEAIDYSVSPSTLTFGASEKDKTLRVSAANDSVVDPGESVALSFGTTLPEERISEGDIAQTTVAIRDTDFTFAPAFAAGAATTESDTDTYTVSENASALRLSLSLETPRGALVVDIVDPVVVTLATRENAGSKGMDEDYATERRSGTFGDFGEFDRDLSFAPGEFSDDPTCGCARAEKAVSVDLFNDRIHERVEVFGLRLSRKSGRLGVASEDITAKIAEDDAEPVLTLEANPGSIAEAGGTSTVTVSTGSGSTFPAAQTIRLDLSGTATLGTDYTVDSTTLTLPAGVGQDLSSVTTTVRAKDDPIDDDGETVVLAASRDTVEFARRSIGIDDDETGSTQVDLAVNPAQVREDAGATTVRVTASLDADARGQDTEVTVTVGASGDSAVEGTDYGTVGELSLTIDAGETTAETTFSLNPSNNDSVDGAKTITVDGSASGLAVRSADLTLNDDDVASTTVTLTLDPLEVSESAGSRTVRVTGTLDGGARATETVVTVTVGSGADSALEETDYADVPELELTIPANETTGQTTFTLSPENDAIAEGAETISVSGDVAGLTVVSAELALADDDSPSTRLVLSLNPSTVSEAAVPTDVVVTGSLNAGARTSDSVVTVTVGASTDTATEGLDYADVSALEITVPANATTGQTMFTLSPENDAIAERGETISVIGRTNGLTVEPATLTLSDNDTASRVVTLTVEPESVYEDTPEDVTVTASLNAGARAEDTEVRLTVGAAGDTAVPGADYERVSERTLTIMAGETSGTEVFRLEPANNDSTDGARTLSVTGSTTVAELRIEPASGARVALDDDDNPAVLVVPNTLTVVEAESNTYTVELQTRPTADVTVTIGGVSGDLSLDKTSLVFTQADWRVSQPVEVTAADDDDSVQDPDVTLTHRASGAAEYGGLGADLVVSIRENDPGLVFSDSSLTVPEGETATYTVALATLPTADVTVRVAGVSGDLSLVDPMPSTPLVFTPGDWGDAQTVTVGAAEDDDSSTDPGGDTDARGLRRRVRWHRRRTAGLGGGKRWRRRWWWRRWRRRRR